MSESKLSQIVAEYNKEKAKLEPGAALELEIRFRNITKEVFENLFHSIRQTPEFAPGVLECSVNFISENIHDRRDNTKYINKVLFNAGIAIGNVYMTKSKIYSVVVAGFVERLLELSIEKTIEKFPSSPTALIRFKIRASFDYIGTTGSRWRIDMTLVHASKLNKVGSDLKNIRDTIFRKDLTVANMLETDPDMIDSYEVECEFIGNNPSVEDFNISDKVFSLVNPDYVKDIMYQEEIYHIATFIIDKAILYQFKQPNYRLKQLSNQVMSLSKNTYYSDIYPPEGFFLTDKADGIRAFISIRNGRCRVVRSDGMKEYTIAENTAANTTIVDAEIIDDKPYIFDVMVVDGNNISGQPFSSRVGYLEQAAAIVSRYLPATIKKYVRITSKMNEFAEVWNAKYPYTLDGLIMTEPGAAYRETKNYKWKPFELNTIDLLAMKCPSNLLGIKPFDVVKGKTLYILFCGISNHVRNKLGLPIINGYRKLFPSFGDYGPIQFSPSANPLAFRWYRDNDDIPDGTIVELGRTVDNSEWVFHRTREDRKMEKLYFGNDYRIAEMTYLNYLNPFNLSDLWTPSSGYFTKTVNNIYEAPNRFKRFVISALLELSFTDADWIIDLAAGRGADLPQLKRIKVKNGLFIDIDPLALAELVRRKYSIRTGGAEALIKENDSLSVHTMVMDLRTDYSEMIASTYQFGVNTGSIDGIICNFALHYLCDSAINIRNILRFVSQMLKVGGIFGFTVMDGKKVFDLLADLPTNGTWEVRENDVKKYAITKKYTSPKLTAAGQMISVLLPFTDDMYDEPLCNVENFIAEARKFELKLENDGSMLNYKDKFVKARDGIASRLTDDDLKYIDLHRFVTLKKTKNTKV